jgi:hypothetical protein
MGTRHEHAHCLETINNMWLLGKRETVNAWKKADFDGFREKENRSEVSSKWNHHHKFIKYEKRLRKEGKNMFGLPIKQNICKFSASLDA